MTWLCIIIGAIVGYVAIPFGHVMFSYFRAYRKAIKGRWELRGHWCRYPHEITGIDYRVHKYGVADDVEDW